MTTLLIHINKYVSILNSFLKGIYIPSPLFILPHVCSIFAIQICILIGFTQVFTIKNKLLQAFSWFFRVKLYSSLMGKWHLFYGRVCAVSFTGQDTTAEIRLRSRPVWRLQNIKEGPGRGDQRRRSRQEFPPKGPCRKGEDMCWRSALTEQMGFFKQHKDRVLSTIVCLTLWPEKGFHHRLGTNTYVGLDRRLWVWRTFTEIPQPWRTWVELGPYCYYQRTQDRDNYIGYMQKHRLKE